MCADVRGASLPTSADLARSTRVTDPDTLERFVTLEHWVERHKFHMDALEKVLRLWENDKVHQRQIDEIRDEVENYIANNQDADFYENEHIYEDVRHPRHKLANCFIDRLIG